MLWNVIMYLSALYTYTYNKYLPISTWNWIFIDWTEHDDNVAGYATCTTGVLHLDILMALIVRLRRWSSNISSHPPQSGSIFKTDFRKNHFPVCVSAFRNFLNHDAHSSTARTYFIGFIFVYYVYISRYILTHLYVIIYNIMCIIQ